MFHWLDFILFIYYFLILIFYYFFFKSGVLLLDIFLNSWQNWIDRF